MVRRGLPALLAAAAATLGPAAGCDEDDPDPRFATPEATIGTLMAAYGVDRMSQDEIQLRMRSRERFQLRDEVSYRACFDDYEGIHHEGLAGFVFGTIAAGKDDLEIVHAQGKAHVYPDPERRDRSVVLVEREGEWKISLRDSVPSDIRRALLEEYRRAKGRASRAGSPE